MIEKIRCPRLNDHYRERAIIHRPTVVVAAVDVFPNLDVLVRFADVGGGEIPIGIMCNLYDDGKCRAGEGADCTYREWKKI